MGRRLRFFRDDPAAGKSARQAAGTEFPYNSIRDRSHNGIVMWPTTYQGTAKWFYPAIGASIGFVAIR
jgi:hypothetical protein